MAPDAMAPMRPAVQRSTSPRPSHLPTQSEGREREFAEFGLIPSGRPDSSPGAGLGAILGSCAADRIPSKTPTGTGSAYMTGEQDVKLYMYDLSKGMARALAPVLGSWLSAEEFDGVWHSGVVVFGQEYIFNGDLVHTGPGLSAWGVPTKVVTIGHTSCSRQSLHQFIVSDLRSLFNRTSYDALANNCNHFADRVCWHLCRRHIPDHILQQPEKLAKLPALRLLRPFLDQWFGGGADESCDAVVQSARIEDSGPEPAARKRSVRRKPGDTIVRGASLGPNEAHRERERERSQPPPDTKLGPSSPRAVSPHQRLSNEASSARRKDYDKNMGREVVTSHRRRAH